MQPMICFVGYTKTIICHFKLTQYKINMNQEEIIKRLKEGNKFTGRNGAFTGIVTPLIYADKANMLVVECEKDGCKFQDDWILLHTIWGFQNGDYVFI